MLLLYIKFITVTAIIGAAWAKSYKEINFSLIDDLTGTTGSQLYHSVEKTKSFIEEHDLKIAKTGLGIVPYIDMLSTLLTAIEVNIKEELLKKIIVDERDRAITQNSLRDIRATMVNIKENIENLNGRYSNLTSSRKHIIIHAVYEDLKRLVNKYDDPESIFKKYPLLTVDTLFELASFIAIFSHMAETIFPEIVDWRLTCKFSETLLEYRPLVVRDRLAQLEIKANCATSLRVLNPGLCIDCREDEIRSNSLFKILGQLYSPYGYDDETSNAVNSDCYNIQNDRDYGCSGFFLKDRINDKNYYWGPKHNHMTINQWKALEKKHIKCMRGIMGHLRFGTEQAFVAPLEFMNPACRSQPLTGKLQFMNTFFFNFVDFLLYPFQISTGLGWLTINIHRAHKDFGEPNCDLFTHCDFYVKIFLNGTSVSLTPTKINENEAIFMHTYHR